MDSDYLTSASALFTMVPNLLLPAVALYLLWIMKNTESFYLLKKRLLRLLGGSSSFSDPKMQKIVQQHEELQHFNWHLDLNLSSTQNFHRLLAWAKHYGLEISTLSRARPYFDVNALSVNIWSRGVVISIALVAFLLIILSLAFAEFLICSPYALLQVKATGTWFWASYESAHGIAWGWALDKGQCLLDQTAAPLQRMIDKSIICQVVLSEDAAFIQEGRKTCTHLGIALIVLTWCALHFAGFKSNKAIHALRLKRTIAEKNESLKKHRLP